MSQENVEIVRRVLEAEARGDYDTVFALYDPEIELDNTRSRAADFMGTVGGVYRGQEAFRNAWKQWYDAWTRIEGDVEELIDAGDGQVVVVITYRGKGRASGVAVEFPHIAGTWTIRNGKVVRMAWLRSREEALEEAETQKAAGLSE